jgi:hypothetical protein
MEKRKDRPKGSKAKVTVQNNPEDSQYMGIQMLFKYFLLKTSTLYSLVGKLKISFYKIGWLGRFKKSDIDLWMQSHKREFLDFPRAARKIILAFWDRSDEIKKRCRSPTKSYVLQPLRRKNSIIKRRILKCQKYFLEMDHPTAWALTTLTTKKGR